MNKTRLRILTGRSQTIWLFTSVAEGLNSGPRRPPDFKSGILTTRPRCFLSCHLNLSILIFFNSTFHFLFDWQEGSMIYVHDTGAVLLFGSGALFCWVQTYLTYKLTQLGINSQFLFTIRFILTCVISVFGSIFFVAEIFAYEEFRQQSAHVVANWQPSDPGYSIHVLSNIGEWIAALCFGMFGLTFFEEFQKISFLVECSQKCENRQSSPLLEYTNINSGDEE